MEKGNASVKSEASKRAKMRTVFIKAMMEHFGPKNALSSVQPHYVWGRGRNAGVKSETEKRGETAGNICIHAIPHETMMSGVWRIMYGGDGVPSHN